MQNKWGLYQYDIKNAFVYTNINKEIYIEQPLGFENNSYIKDNNK
jgi:hypothetical protein